MMRVYPVSITANELKMQMRSAGITRAAHVTYNVAPGNK